MQGKPESHVDPPRGCELVSLKTRDGDTIKALYGPALLPNGAADPDAARRPTLIYFYGNGTMMSYSMQEFMTFRRLRANVAIAEYAGYGISTGSPSEKSFYATADAVYDFIASHPGVDPRQIIPTGWSIGSGVAIDLAHHKPVAAVATFSAFTSMKAAAQHMLPFLPVGLLLQHHFDNKTKIGELKVPLFLAHGTKDTLVPFYMNAELAKAAKSPVTVVPVEGAGHNDIFDTGGDDLMQKLGRFIESVHQNVITREAATTTQPTTRS